jgi:hypothetical protein
VAWLLTRIFSFFYYRGEQRKSQKQLSELWVAFQAELQWLASHAADLLADVPDVLCAAIACKRLEERGYETFWLKEMLQSNDAAFLATMDCLERAEVSPPEQAWGRILPSESGKQEGQRAYWGKELLPLLVAVRERDSNTAKETPSGAGLAATRQSERGRDKKTRLRGRQTRRSQAAEQPPSRGRRQRRHRA